MYGSITLIIFFQTTCIIMFSAKHHRRDVIVNIIPLFINHIGKPQKNIWYNDDETTQIVAHED